MIASQLLYTSWKNGQSPYKGFMIYAKSKDITDEESYEICNRMRYKPPYDLPFEPNCEEIKTLFPKAFAYFKLSSGRYCIAQTTYVGQDFTLHYGNYIIHAYVLEDIGDIVPLQLMNTGVFRNCLTDEELNASFAPESLPHVEFVNGSAVFAKKDLDEFLNIKNRRAILKKLIQALSNDSNKSKKIFFYDDYHNYQYWIAALLMTIGEKRSKTVYYHTFYHDYYDNLFLDEGSSFVFCLREKGCLSRHPSYIKDEIIICPE